MKRPSFQFYPGDWRGNANLGRCSFAARGAWIDVLSVLHDSDEYGIVRWPLAELANSAKVPLKFLRELVDKCVLKGAEKGSEIEAFVYVPRSGRKNGPPVTLLDPQAGPIWYSSRMVKDEYVRTQAGSSTRFGSHGEDESGEYSARGGHGKSKANRAKQREKSDTTPDGLEAPRRSPSRRHGEDQGDGSSTSSSSSSSPSGSSEANASASTAAQQAAAFTLEQAEAMTKEELWSAGKSLLAAAKVPAAQCGSFIGGLVKQFTAEVVIDVVRAAVVEVPADPRGWMRAACQTRVGQRRAALNRQEALEASNKAIGERWLAEQRDPA